MSDAPLNRERAEQAVGRLRDADVEQRVIRDILEFAEHVHRERADADPPREWLKRPTRLADLPSFGDWRDVHPELAELPEARYLHAAEAAALSVGTPRTATAVFERRADDPTAGPRANVIRDRIREAGGRELESTVLGTPPADADPETGGVAWAVDFALYEFGAVREQLERDIGRWPDHLVISQLRALNQFPGLPGPMVPDSVVERAARPEPRLKSTVVLDGRETITDYNFRLPPLARADHAADGVEATLRRLVDRADTGVPAEVTAHPEFIRGFGGVLDAKLDEEGLDEVLVPHVEHDDIAAPVDAVLDLLNAVTAGARETWGASDSGDG